MPHNLTIDLLSDLIAFDTTSRNSNLELISYIEDYLAKRGIESRRIYNKDRQKANLLATIGPQDVPGYVLSAHTDVVPVDDQDWLSNPFSATLRDGKLYGRGTCDMKGFLACVLAKVDDFHSAPLNKPIHLAFSYDEEVGCLGARDIVSDMAAWPVRPEACFVGEPTGMDVVTAHKSKRSERVIVRGQGAHSSLAPLAVNAVEFAARLVVYISDMGRTLASSGPRDELFDIPVSTAHVGKLNGGVQLNIVPDYCDFDYEFRGLPQEDVSKLAAKLHAFAKDVLEPQMKAVNPNTSIEFQLLSDTPGLDTPPDWPVIGLAKAFSGKNAHAKVAYVTEAGLFATRADVPTVICGPGHIDQAHKANEYVALSQLERCEQFLARLITHACK